MVTPSQRNSRHVTILRRLVRAVQRIDQEDGAVIKTHGLSPSEFDVVATLGNTEGLRMCELANRSLKTAANLTRIASKLEGRGLVQRARSKQSDREVIARLTDEGEALFERVYPEVTHARKGDFDERLTAGEQQQLLALLEKII